MLLYLAIFLLGFLFLIITFLAGEVFDFIGDHFSHDGDTSHALSSKTVAAGMTAFGAAGMITRVYGFGTGVGVIVSFMVAVAFGAGTAWLMSVLYSQTASTNVSVASMVGNVAEVTVRIEPDSVGEVLLWSAESTRHMLARSAHGEALASGARVRVVEAHGNVVVVEPAALQASGTGSAGDPDMKMAKGKGN